MEYYCAAITENGFFDSFSDVFSEKRLRRLYVIKWASGVGKSTLMRKAALEGEKRGFSVDRIYCSSDPSSLDGIIMGNIGMIDGTPPHAYEPKMAGAFESLIDLGRFWDSSALVSQREELFRLSKKKKNAFERIYAFASIYGKLLSLEMSRTLESIDKPSVKRYARSLVRRKLSEAKKGSAEMRIFSSLFDSSITPKHERIYTVDDKHGFGSLFLEELKNALTEIGAEFFYSPKLPSIERLETIYVPSLGIIYTSHKGGRNICGKRFFHEEPSPSRERELTVPTKNAILDSHREAMRYHSEIEKIYAKAMDFEGLNKYTEKLFGEFFSLIDE